MLHSKAGKEYDERTIQQMAGRAGRPQFDTKGRVVILTSADRVVTPLAHFSLRQQGFYTNVFSRSTAVESHLHAQLHQHVNSEIVLRTINDVSQALQWIRGTFYCARLPFDQPSLVADIRARANPRHYFSSICAVSDVDRRIQELLLKVISDLEQAGASGDGHW